jgi:predicted nucleic acid-binding protein
VISYLYDEQGADIVENILKEAEADKIKLYMNKLNLYEVYYNVYRDYDIIKADEILRLIQGYPIDIIESISDDVIRKAAYYKENYRMSLADSIALGETSIRGASIVTSDHHEFDPLDESNELSFTWIR